METYSPTLDDVFHALADATRRSVVTRLAKGSASIMELMAPHRLGLPAFLKHIKVLERCGLITTQKAGRVRTCALKQENLLAVEKWFDEQQAVWKSRYDNLDTLLVNLKGNDDET